MNYILDTCIFNKLVDGIISFSDLPNDGQFFITHIQLDELKKTSDPERKDVLIGKFKEIAPKETFPCFIPDVTRIDASVAGIGDLCTRLRSALDKKNCGKSNNINDAAIAEVAIREGITLITSDEAFAKVTEDYGGEVIFFDPNTGGQRFPQ